MYTIDRQYEDLLADVLKHGVEKKDRTGVGTLSVFGRQIRYDLRNGFPRITTKFVPMKAVKGELLWFLSGETNIKWLKDHGISIWDEWADADGNLGPVYGHQWRSWPAPDGKGVDQIYEVVESLKADPDSRRHIVSAWNVGDLDAMALAPCHVLFQFYVAGGRLSCQLYQRSADLFLGVPFNIASYSLLTHMVAQQTGYDVGEFIWTGGDCHIYKNHVVAVREQLGRKPYPFPELSLKKAPSIFEYEMSDIYASAGYKHHPAIKAPVAV